MLTGKRVESVCASRHLAAPQWLGTARHSLLVVDVMSETPSVSPDTCSAHIYPEDACSIKEQSFLSQSVRWSIFVADTGTQQNIELHAAWKWFRKRNIAAGLCVAGNGQDELIITGYETWYSLASCTVLAKLTVRVSKFWINSKAVNHNPSLPT